MLKLNDHGESAFAALSGQVVKTELGTESAFVCFGNYQLFLKTVKNVGIHKLPDVIAQSLKTVLPYGKDDT